MTAFKIFRYSNPEHGAASAVPCRRHPPSTINAPAWLVWLTLAVMLAFTTSPALPQAGFPVCRLTFRSWGRAIE